MTETSITEFHTSLYITEIKIYHFNLHMHAMKHSNIEEPFSDILCRRYYSKRVVDSSIHQIQSEYYGRNQYVSIEVIVM